MTSRNFFLLAVLAVAALATALLIQRPDIRTGADTGRYLLPALKDQVNSVNRVEIITAGNTLVAGLSKTADRWEVDEPEHYPANWEKLRQVLADLAAAQIVEAKTTNPDFYDRLGVQAIEDEDAGGTLLRLSSEDGSWAVIIGDAARNRQGQYARKADQAESVLLDKSFDLSGDKLGWLVREIIDLPADEVLAVAITQPAGDRVELSKADPGSKDFVLLNLPEGRKSKSAYSVTSVASGLANLRLDAVRQVTDVDFTGSIKSEFTTNDNRIITLDLIKQDDKSWLKLAAALVPSSGDEAGDDVTAEESVQLAETAETETGTENEESAAEWVTDFNARVGNWAFAVPGYKYDELTRAMEDLLESPEEEDDS